MKAAARSALLFGAVTVLTFLPFYFATFIHPAQAAVGTSLVRSLAETIRDAHLPELLVPTSSTTTAENLALTQAIAAYKRRVDPEDVTSLKGFLGRYPQSGWAPALQTNLGLIYLHYGYFSLALDAWKAAWEQGKSATGLRAKALVDRAVGELARLDASLGHFNELSALFVEIGDRKVSGSATEAIQTAREELALAGKDPRHLFLCGPMALMSLTLAEGVPVQQVSFLQWYRASARGTNLAELSKLADKLHFAHRLIFRKPGQPVPVPSIVHWKVGHFAAIVDKANGRYKIKDPVFQGQSLWVTTEAIDAEASGYFLTLAYAQPHARWRSVSIAEARAVWGKGPTNGTQAGGAGPQQDPQADGGSGDGPNSGTSGSGGSASGAAAGSAGAGGDGGNGGPNGGNGSGNGPNGPDPNCGMCGYNIGESTVSVTLVDTPVGYTPPIGPAPRVTITYNQREDSQPANFNFFNVSPKWTLSWLSYVTDDPNNPGANVTRYLPGGGAYSYVGYNSATGAFAAQNNDGSILALASETPVTYRRQLGNGTIEIYAQSDGSTSYPRNIFLSKVIDPQGNTLTLNYDSEMRLLSLTDAIGRQTTFTYGLSGQPLLVTQITDPFGRSASLTYDSSGRLNSITDVLGLTSTFTYDANSLVDALTTPYGTTSFAYTAPGTSAPPRFVQVTDPLGYNEREEWLEPAPIPDSDPSDTVPQGMSTTNEYLTYRDSFHWDKDQYVAAGCTPTGGCDYTKARDRHFNHVPNTSLKSTSIESVKYPLENRIWYNYPDQVQSIWAGTYEQPTAAGRVLDDGTTQLRQYSYDTTGYYKLTQVIDPLGRTTSYAYANHIDLSAISQITAYGVATTIAQFIYNTQHRPIFYTDAAGQTTRYTYNAAGQLTSVTNPLGQTTQYQYDSSNNLTTIINANGVTAASFTYDAFDRIATYTDSEGWSASYSYDNADRVTKITYPDGTSDNYTYDRLDLASYQDRLGRLWTYTHDADRRLTEIADPLGHQTLLGYNGINELTSLTDPNGNVTTWAYDVEGRLTTKEYADSSAANYTYENTTSRLKSVLDALGQTKQYGYAEDNRPTSFTYVNAINPTPNVAFTYDLYFPRVTSMTDGNGTTQYSYEPVGSLGAMQLQQEIPSPSGGAAIAYQYDALRRLVSQTVAGAGAETFGYDAIGRLISHDSDLGAFSLTYLGQTRQITQRQLVNTALSTDWSYLPNSSDRRLASINNSGFSTTQYSNYNYTTIPENFITAASETSDTPTVYPSLSTQSATYNNLNQLVSLSGQAVTFDANGNITSDGTRNYTFDAENRLVGITYPSQPGKQTTFTYDGRGRRTAITSTPTGGGSSVAITYVWCGTRICQARNANNEILREYFLEGEFIPGSPAESFYYATDQIGSIRRVFESTSSAPAYSYDPFGNSLQATPLITDIGYAGMFYNADSGLYLTRYRAYDPVSGRWLSRDPIPATGALVANLYTYVGGNPISFTDRLGLCSDPLQDLINALNSNSWLPLLVAATEVAGGGPEDPLADAAVAAEVASAEEGEAGVTSAYVDTTDQGALITNITTDVNPENFVQNLEQNGYQQTSVSADQQATVYTGPNGNTYTVRPSSSAPGGQAADFTPAGSPNMTLKINLGP